MDTQDDVASRQTMLTLAKCLARPTPDEVAAYRQAHGTLWYDQPEPGVAGVILQRDHFKRS